jgi:hypothetical protein
MLIKVKDLPQPYQRLWIRACFSAIYAAFLGGPPMLIDGESDTSILAAEDAAIIAAENAPEMVDGVTVAAPVGTALADFITLLGETDGDPPPIHEA